MAKAEPPENWKRPAVEVNTLMIMLRMSMRMFLPRLRAGDIRFHHLGIQEGLPEGIIKDLHRLEEQTAHHDGMVFHLAVNYGSRLELVEATRRCVQDGLKPEQIDEAAVGARLWTFGAPDVDLLIRTSGEMRISNFLLWQSAYAEFYITERLWPDFGEEDLLAALKDYDQRQRRFGGL